MRRALLESIKNELIESLSISDNVRTETENLIDAICGNLTHVSWGYKNSNNVKHISFKYILFDKQYTIDVFYKNYSSRKECNIANEQGAFDSYVDFNDNIIMFKLGAVNGIPYELYFDDIITHELQHIYKSYKGVEIKSKYDIHSVFTKENYEKLKSIYSNKTNNIKIRYVAYALYASYEYEMNGFLGGLYSLFNTCPIKNPKTREELRMTEDYKKNVILKSKCFKALEMIYHSIEYIDGMDGSIVYNIFGITKPYIKKVLIKSKSEYTKKMSRIVLEFSSLYGVDRKIIHKINESDYGYRIYGHYWLA